jgi:hypothetical protein
MSGKNLVMVDVNMQSVITTPLRGGPTSAAGGGRGGRTGGATRHRRSAATGGKRGHLSGGTGAFPRDWPLVRGLRAAHEAPVTHGASPHACEWPESPLSIAS